MNATLAVRHLNQVLSNIDQDARLDDSEKHLARGSATRHHAAQIGQLERECTVWDNSRSAQIGTLTSPAEPCACPPDTRLGNTWAILAFENSVAKQLRCDYAEAQRIVELACKTPALRAADDQDEIDLVYERLTLRNDRDCWLFAGTRSDDPFAGADPGTLPCRLGLPYREGERYATFTLPVPADARRPCVLDVAWFFQQFWRPGGRTRPFCAAGVEEGLEEWIATPPSLRAIGNPRSIETVVCGNPADLLPYDDVS